MDVDRVSACIRFSQDTGKGAWKVVEVAAEGTVGALEEWREAQTRLYTELSSQLKELWAGSKSAEVEPSPIQTAEQHWCLEHDMAFSRRTGKNGNEWFSHKASDGGWCRE